MELHLDREPSGARFTYGQLFVNGQYECETLEDVVRAVKIAGETAIPNGRYRVTLEDSPRFGRDTITVKDVPNFTHIRIHAGNTEKDTDGCILVGQVRGERSILRSRIALAHLKEKVSAGLQDGGEVWLTIRNMGG